MKSRLIRAIGALCFLPATCFAQVITFDFEAIWTLLSPTGEFVVNSSATDNEFFGNRTNIFGSLNYDVSSGNGAFTINSFMLSGDEAIFVDPSMSFDAGSNLKIGNMGMNWNGTEGFPVSLVWDTTGLVNATAAGLFIGNNLTNDQLIQNGSVTNASLGSVIPASSNTAIVTSGGPGGGTTTTFPLGPSLIATTTWDTTPVNPPVIVGDNPSGKLPLVTDLVVDATNGDIGLGGSPMQAGPFEGYSINIDFNKLVVTDISAVPVPAAVWLFGSGLLGLIGMAKRKKA